MPSKLKGKCAGAMVELQKYDIGTLRNKVPTTTYHKHSETCDRLAALCKTTAFFGPNSTYDSPATPSADFDLRSM